MAGSSSTPPEAAGQGPGWTPGRILRIASPWLVSALALGYVLGFGVDWKALPEATAQAHFSLYVTITAIDKLLFFGIWGVLQAGVINRFVERVDTRRVLEIKAGSELLRTLNNSLADAAFAVGVAQMARGRFAAVIAVATIPFVCHFLVLLLQASAMLPLLSGGLQANRDVATVVFLGWGLVGAAAIASRLGWWQRLLAPTGLAEFAGRITLRALAPFLACFVVFAVFDVVIQGLASRAFGVTIPWAALAARLPILYLAMSLPSLGNFGTREIAWAECFAEYGSREALVAFALWTNVIFLVMHVLIGAPFFARALQLVRQIRRARASGEKITGPLLHDAIDP